MSGRYQEIGLLLYPGAQLAVVYDLGDLFSVTNRMAASQGREGVDRLRVSHWQVDDVGQVRRVFDSQPQAAGAPRVVILPSCLDATGYVLEAPYCHWLGSLRASGVMLASVCAGAFPLAEAGLLEGRAVTTHWALAGELTMKPTEYCQQLRVTKARELLEFTRHSIDQVAWQVGYRDGGTFRKVFARLVGVSPGDYRRRFGTVAR